MLEFIVLITKHVIRPDSALKFQLYHIPGILPLSSNTQPLDIFPCSSCFPDETNKRNSSDKRQCVYKCLTFDFIVSHVLNLTTYFVIVYTSVLKTALHTLRYCTVRNTSPYLIFVTFSYTCMRTAIHTWHRTEGSWETLRDRKMISQACSAQ